MPIIGTIQCTCFSAVQPYQKKVIGRMQAKMIIKGRRISGSNTPLFFEVDLTSILSLVRPMNISPQIKPMPMPRYASPESPVEKPYWLVNTDDIVVKKR